MFFHFISKVHVLKKNNDKIRKNLGGIFVFKIFKDRQLSAISKKHLGKLIFRGLKVHEYVYYVFCH